MNWFKNLLFIFKNLLFIVKNLLFTWNIRIIEHLHARKNNKFTNHEVSISYLRHASRSGFSTLLMMQMLEKEQLKILQIHLAAIESLDKD